MTAPPTFWKPGSARPGSSLDRDSEAEPALLTSATTSSSSSLPIAAQRDSILYALERHQVLIVVGETGSGKTTQIPRFLYDAGWTTAAPASAGNMIACTQPRRLAAVSIAATVAAQMGVRLGHEVGYTIRFEDNSSAATRIKYMTDGTLFRECIKDPLLTRYSVIMVDEAHERGVHTDLLLGVLFKILRKRPELRVIVASATIDALTFKDFFEDSRIVSQADHKHKQDRATVLQIKGRSFPVHVAYLDEPCEDYLQKTVDTIWNIHLAEPRGDILAFLTGRDEIDTALQLLADRQLDLPDSAARMHLLPLHAGLSASEQTAVFAAPPSSALRKVVVATNIAEASITLDGIVYVVDCGLVKLRATTGAGRDTLGVVPISRASAVQRAGRAGRTREGKCFRLYTERSLEQMHASTPPELTRVDLAAPVLMLKALGIDNLARFEWVPPAPPPALLAAGLQRLVQLGALDEYARLTDRGAVMAELPLPPHLARILVASAEPAFACAHEMLAILATMQVSTLFVSPHTPQTQLSQRAFAAQQGDVFTLLNVFLAFTDERVGRQSAKWAQRHRLNFPALSRALSIRQQLERFMVRFGLDTKCSVRGREDAVERITRCMLTGLYANVARYDPVRMTYTTTAGHKAWAHPDSVFFNRRPEADWIAYGEAVQQATSDGTKTYLRDLLALPDLEWAASAVPGYYTVSTQWGHGTKSPSL